MFRIASVLMVALAAGSQMTAATPMTKMRVEERSTADKPVDRASVIVTLDKGRSALKLGRKVRTHWEMRTNQEGVASIPPLPQGTFLIQVTAKGYQTFGQTFEVKEEEKTIEVKMNAPQPQYSAH